MPAGYGGPSGRKNKAPLSAWAQRGVARVDGARLSGDAQAGLLLPAGPKGPGFLVSRNFDAIYSYNPAESYALAMSLLADRLAGEPALRTPWPTDDPGLSRAERLQLQQLLLAQGYDIGEADGKIGPAPAPRSDGEQRLGMPQTGRAGLRCIRRWVDNSRRRQAGARLRQCDQKRSKRSSSWSDWHSVAWIGRETCGSRICTL